MLPESLALRWACLFQLLLLQESGWRRKWCIRWIKDCFRWYVSKGEVAFKRRNGPLDKHWSGWQKFLHPAQEFNMVPCLAKITALEKKLKPYSILQRRSQPTISVESWIKILELEKYSYDVHFIWYKVLKQVVLAVLKISQIITNCCFDLLLWHYSDSVWRVLWLLLVYLSWMISKLLLICSV